MFLREICSDLIKSNNFLTAYLEILIKTGRENVDQYFVNFLIKVLLILYMKQIDNVNKAWYTKTNLY